MINSTEEETDFLKLEKLKDYFERPIVLLGGGQLGKMALEMWPNEKLPKPICILDKNPSVDNFAGIECIKLGNHKFIQQNTYVLSFFKETPKVIVELFSEIGQPIITIYDLLTYYCPHLFTNGWSGNILAHEREALLKTFDNQSTKQLILDVISWRASRRLPLSYCVDSENDKYKLPDEALISGHHFDLVLDGGSFDGGFLDTLKAQEISYDSAILVEPDPVSRKNVSRYVLSNSLENIEVCSKALYENTDNQPFNANGLLSSRIIQNDSIQLVTEHINCITLSTLLQHGALNKKMDKMRALIKLHIEGAEWPVVRESIETLKMFGEVLVFINLSHDQESFTRIPPLLKSEGFTLSLYSHSLFGEGLTLTAHRKS